MAENIDIASLAIEVSADSQNASVNIDKLSESLNKLKSGSLKEFCSSLESLSNALGTLKTACASIDAVGNLTQKMSEMNDVDYDKAVTGFKALANAVGRLTSAAPALNAVDFSGLSTSMSKLSDALTPIKQIGDESARASAYLINAVAKVPAAAKKLNDVDFDSFKSSVKSLKNSVTPLLGMNYDKLKGLGSALNALSKVPKVSESLKDFDWETFASSCQKAADALTPLASNLNVVAASFAKLPSKLSSVITATNRLTTSNNNTKKSYGGLGNQLEAFAKKAASLFSLSSIGHYLGEAATSFNDFYEATDLFHNAMGDLSDDATELIDKMESLLGVDPTNAMSYMATIQSLGTSFGLTSDKAYILSKNLTQLAYDEGSYWNKDVSETFTAMSSAISGEIEPIRRLGIDLSQARLQQELLSLGFTQQVSSLSQADKAVLRYIAIMKQTANIQGNLAQTINSPANQIKVLKSEINQLSKSVGSILYPALKSILPVLIAAVELLKEFVSALASLFGQKIEFTDFSQTTSSLGGVTDALDDTTDATKAAAKAAKDYTMGFDELNIIEPQTDTSSDSGSGSGSSGNILGDVDLSGYDMFADYIGEQVNSVKGKIEELLPIIGTVAAAFATWKVTEFLGELVKVLSNLNLIQKAALMAVTLVVEWTFVQKNADDFLKTGDTFALIKEWLVTGAATIAGSLLFGTKGATLTLAISAIAQLNSLNYALKNATVGTVDKQYWIQLISASVTGGLAGLVLTHSATGFVVTASLTAALELMQTAYLESKNGTLEIGGVMNQILAGLAGATTGTAGVAIALAAGASVPVAGAVLVATFGLGVVLEQVGVSMGSYDRIEEIRQYIADYESKGYNELAIKMRLKNLGYSDEEIELAENEATTQFDIFKYDMGELIGGVIDSINDYWENESLLHGAIEQAEIGAAQLKESIDTICDNFIGWCSSIQENAAEAGRATAEWFNSVKDKAAEKVVEVKEKVEEGFSNAASAISAKYSELKESVTTWAAGIKDGLANKAESVKEKASEIASSIKTKFSELSLVETAQNIIQTLITGISNFIENVKTKAGEIATAVKDKIAELSLVETAQNIIQTFITGVSNLIESVKTKASEVATAVKSKIAELSLVETAKNIIQTLITGIGNLIESVKAKAGEVTSGIKSTFEGLSLFDIGKNLIQGLINGISGMVEDVKKTVGGLADSAITKLKDVLGIHSPSTVTAEVGSYFDEGLQNGINDGIEMLKTITNDLATGIIGALRTGLGEDKDPTTAYDMGAQVAKDTQDGLESIKEDVATSFGKVATYFGETFWDNLDSEWANIDENLQADAVGTIKDLYDTLTSDDVGKKAKLCASFFYSHLSDEQKTQIKDLCKNALSWLNSGLNSAFTSLSQLAASLIAKFVPSATTATAAQTGLNVAMDANPIMLVISLIGMLVGALVSFSGTNDDVADGVSSVWSGLEDMLSYVWEGILRIMGTGVQFIINQINFLIAAYNSVAWLWGSQVDYVQNPLYKYADQVAEEREKRHKEAEEKAKEKTEIGTDDTDYKAKYEQAQKEYEEQLAQLTEQQKQTQQELLTQQELEIKTQNKEEISNLQAQIDELTQQLADATSASGSSDESTLNSTSSHTSGSSSSGSSSSSSSNDYYKQKYAELQQQYQELKSSSSSSKIAGTSAPNSSATSYSSASAVTVDFNEEEMRESVYNGTYNALLDIFQRYGDTLTGGKELSIYLDGKQITASVEKTQNKRGQSLMGNEVYSY